MNKYDIITEDLLFGLFTYEKGTGELRWRTDRRRGVKAGSLVGERNKGYRQTNILGYCYKVHKLVWFLEHGSFPSGHIDHIDGNKQNNQPENLREVTQQENNHNQRFAKGYYKTKKGKYHAQIKLDGKVIYLGSYTTEEEARAAYLEAKKTLHPSFIHCL